MTLLQVLSWLDSGRGADHRLNEKRLAGTPARRLRPDLYSGWRGEDVEGQGEDDGAGPERDGLVVVVRHEVQSARERARARARERKRARDKIEFQSLREIHRSRIRVQELVFTASDFSERELYRRPAPVLA